MTMIFPRWSGGPAGWSAIFWLLVLVILSAGVVFSGAGTVRGGEGTLKSRPVALVGDSYGRHEVTSLTRNIFDREDWVFEDRGTFLPAEEFSRYSLVVLCHSLARPYTRQEQEVIRTYLENGGRVLLLNQVGRTLSDAESEGACREWMGFTLRRGKALDPGLVRVADDPVVRGVGKPSWFAETLVATDLAPDAVNLIGEEGQALVVRRPLGKGEVWFAANEMFRMRLPQSPHVTDSDSYVGMLRSIIAQADPLTLAEWEKVRAGDWTAKGRRFLFWNREWQRGTEDRALFLPPLPFEDELVETLVVDLAVDEYEALQLNLTDLGAGGVLEWKVDLGGLPSEALVVFVQDRPDPIPWPKNPALAKESPFWLMPAEALEPQGKNAVRIAAGQTRILWLKWNSHNVAPGSYQGSLRFSVDGTDAGAVDLRVTVHPVRVPKRRAITLQPFGHVYGDVNNVEPALRFKRNLRDHGFEWSLINTLRPDTFLVEGEPLTVRWLQTHRDAVLSATPPRIDFSSLDAFVDAALEHNLTYFRATQNVTESINGLCGKAKLSEEETTAVRQWYLREFARYMADKGIRHLAVSMGDEMHANELRERFLPWSRDLTAAGLGATSSFSTSAVAEKELTEALAPNVKAWTLNRQHLPKFMAWVRDGTIQLPEGTLVGTYGAGEGRGTEIRKNASASRMIGWEAWAQGTDYCAPNPYFKSWMYYTDYSLNRGVGGERFVAFLEQDNLDAPLVNSPFIEGMRESIEEANLAWAMKWYLDKLGDRVPAELRTRAEKLVGSGDGFLLAWKPQPDGEPGFAIDASREAYLQAKREVLEILGALRPLAEKAGLVADAFWNNLPLVRDGQPVARLAGHGDTAAIQSALRDLNGATLPEAGKSFPAEGTVIFVGTPDDSALPGEVKQNLGPHAPEASWIREIPQGNRVVLWVGGTDDKQVAKAVRQFVGFLRAPAAVFQK